MSVTHNLGQDLTPESLFTPTSVLSRPVPRLLCSAQNLQEAGRPSGATEPPQPPLRVGQPLRCPGTGSPADTVRGQSALPRHGQCGGMWQPSGRAEESQVQARRRLCRAWKLARDVWATGKSSTPAQGLQGAGGGVQQSSWLGEGRPARLSSPPIPELSWQTGNHPPQEVFPNGSNPHNFLTLQPQDHIGQEPVLN